MTENGKPEGAPALPEAPASISIRCSLSGFETTVTVRDSDAYRLISKRLPALIAELGKMEAKPAGKPSGNGNGSGEPGKLCELHGETMRKHTGRDGRSWYSHRAEDPETGSEYWCKGGKR